MLTIFHSPKGGSGTTVTAASFALATAERHGKAMLIDMCGDSRAALGMADTDTPGLNDWLGESHVAGPDALISLGTALDNGLLVVHPGSRFVTGAPRWDALVGAVTSWDFPVIIDAGTHYFPDELRGTADDDWLVTRACYLALRRATRMARPTGVIVVREQGRALTVRDVEAVLNVPVVATISFDPSVSRAVDAGVLPARNSETLGPQLPPVK
ncbi:MAG: hypothetical protein RLZZ526_326 [Actinomycetota bacterium]